MRCRNCGDTLTRQREKAVATGEWGEVWQGSESWVCVLTGNEHVAVEGLAYWVVIERRTWEGATMPDLVIGPYDSAEASQLALEESLLIDSICTDTKREFSVEDDVYATDKQDPEGERLYVDLSNPDHTGEANASEVETGSPIRLMSMGREPRSES